MIKVGDVMLESGAAASSPARPSITPRHACCGIPRLISITSSRKAGGTGLWIVLSWNSRTNAVEIVSPSAYTRVRSSFIPALAGLLDEPMSTSLLTRAGAVAATCWAMTLPMECPTIAARSRPSASMKAMTSFAISRGE